MNVLSLFDGISCGQVALKRLGIEVEKYYASEIEDFAIRVTQKNHPETIQLGDVTKWREWEIDRATIDLLFAGFPCQSRSLAGKQLGDKDERGGLMWVMMDVLKNIRSKNPNIKFLFENVKMKKEFIDYVDNVIGVKPILINSALVSCQNRRRNYRTNIEGVTQPKDKGILIKDIIYDKNYKKFQDKRISRTKKKTKNYVKRDISEKGYFSQQCRGYYLNGKLCTVMKGNPCNKLNILIDYENDIYRRLHPIEAERAQTLPDDYTLVKGCTDTKRVGSCGNGWTVDVIAHILSFL